MLLHDQGRGTRTFLGEGRWRVAREGQGKQRTAEHPYMWCSQTTHFTQISAPEGLCVQSPELIRDLTPQQGCLHVYRWVGWVDVWVMWQTSMRTRGALITPLRAQWGSPLTYNLLQPPFLFMSPGKWFIGYADSWATSQNMHHELQKSLITLQK